MAEDRDARVVFDVADEAIGAAGDNEVDIAVLLEERVDDVAGCDELNGVVGHGGAVEGGGDDGGDCGEGGGGFFATWEEVSFVVGVDAGERWE